MNAYKIPSGNTLFWMLQNDFEKLSKEPGQGAIFSDHTSLDAAERIGKFYSHPGKEAAVQKKAPQPAAVGTFPNGKHHISQRAVFHHSFANQPTPNYSLFY